MKPESLQALLIDRECGELSAEAGELLDGWLAEHPESAALAGSIRRSVATASAAVRRFPELARAECAPRVIIFPALRRRLIPLALAASILILLGGATWLGFHAGQQFAQKTASPSQQKAGPVPSENVVNRPGPWARYALASDPRGGITVVRRDVNPQP
jgi:hypothetical protein